MISNPRNHTRVEDAAPSSQPQHEHDGEQHPRRTLPQAKACAWHPPVVKSSWLVVCFTGDRTLDGVA